MITHRVRCRSRLIVVHGNEYTRAVYCMLGQNYSNTHGDVSISIWMPTDLVDYSLRRQPQAWSRREGWAWADLSDRGGGREGGLVGSLARWIAFKRESFLVPASGRALKRPRDGEVDLDTARTIRHLRATRVSHTLRMRRCFESATAQIGTRSVQLSCCGR